MGVIFSGIRYLFGDKDACKSPSAETKARIKYLKRRASYSMVESSLPVFISAAVSGAAGAVISSMNADENAVIVLYAIYCLLCWIVGKYLFYRLVFDEENNSDFPIFTSIRKYKISKLLRQVLSENVGFAWKELMVEVAFTFAFTEFGWGPSFASFIVLGAFFTLVVYISSYVQQKWFNLDHEFNEILLEFDSEAAALPLSFLLTVLLALGLRGTGDGFISSDSYLYEWQEGDDDNYSSTTYDYYFLYATLVTLFVAALMAFEQDCVAGSKEDDEENPRRINNDADHIQKQNSSTSLELELVEHNNNNNRKSSTRKESLSFLHDEAAWEASVEMFHNFLGYFCGISWFILIVDNFNLTIFFPTMNEIVAGFIAMALICLFISFKAPDCMASMKIRQEHTEYVIRKREEAHSTKTEEDLKNEGLCSKLSRSCVNVWLVVSHKRKDLLMLTIRLVLGWTWEVVFKDIFELIASAEEDNKSLNTALQCLLAACIVVLSFFIHRHIKEWDDVEQLPEEQATPIRGDLVQSSAAPRSEVITDSETRSPLS